MTGFRLLSRWWWCPGVDRKDLERRIGPSVLVTSVCVNLLYYHHYHSRRYFWFRSPPLSLTVCTSPLRRDVPLVSKPISPPCSGHLQTPPVRSTSPSFTSPGLRRGTRLLPPSPSLPHLPRSHTHPPFVPSSPSCH